MAKERRVVRGIVLRWADTGEADRILTVLTGELGKVPVVAKGARSRRSRLTAAAQLLAYSELTLSESHGWQYLTEASTIELFDGVRRDVELLSLAGYFAQLADAVTYEGIPSGDVLSLLLNALYALGTLRRPQALVKAAFEVKLLCLSGFGPLLEGCAVCGRTDPASPVLDAAGGELRCRGCAGGEGPAMPLGDAALAALRHVVYGDPRRLYAFTLPDADLKALGRAAEAYAAAQLERGFAALDFYKRIIQP